MPTYHRRAGLEHGGVVTMIGDNPASDIAGSNAAGARWRSALVRTGVFTGGHHCNHHEHPADIVVDHVDAAVQAALHRGRWSRWHAHR
jgi:ribonucleotide monophosphatase NagD (HAD superfamily)